MPQLPTVLTVVLQLNMKETGKQIKDGGKAHAFMPMEISTEVNSRQINGMEKGIVDSLMVPSLEVSGKMTPGFNLLLIRRDAESRDLVLPEVQRAERGDLLFKPEMRMGMLGYLVGMSLLCTWN
jgi:hypothetical protein